MARLAALILAFLLALPVARAVAPAAVDANAATQAELEAVRGIGPATSARIVEERRRGGPFRDLDDLQARVKGIGENNVRKMAAAGLTVGARGVPAVSGAGAAREAGTGGAPVRAGAPVETIVGMPRSDATAPMPPAAPAAAASPGAKASVKAGSKTRSKTGAPAGGPATTTASAGPIASPGR